MMKTRVKLRVGILFSLVAVIPAFAETRYVNINNAMPVAPYTSWASAANVIQDAVDVATPGDEIVVTNGIYATGGRVVQVDLGDTTTTNRVAVNKAVTVRSVNGPERTIIQGRQVPGSTNGYGAIRCVYLADGAVLSGFTLTNGATGANLGGDLNSQSSGGGALCSFGSYGSILTNCVIVGNSASYGGGGARGGTLNNCILNGNSCGYAGGGVLDSRLNNCIVTSNSAFLGGGAQNISGYSSGILKNCTLCGNSAYQAGAALGCTMTNCILYFNTAHDQPEYSGCSFYSCCVRPTPGYIVTGNHNITNDPSFVDWPHGNLRLQNDSPCINVGTSASSIGTIDLDGRPRIVGRVVDMGAYEFQGAGMGEFIGWLQKFGQATDGTADTIDPDGDGLNNWQEWRSGTDPTNTLSVLRLLAPLPVGTKLSVTWQSVAGMSYFLESTTNLSESRVFSLLATNVVGQEGTTGYTDTNAPAVSRIYRVGVSSQ